MAACISQVAAAPPSIAYLHPAGAKRGTTVEVTAGGSFDRWPVQVWTDDPGITAKAAKDKGKLTIAVAADVVPGIHWVRLHDELGASTLRPFIVGTLPDVLDREPNDEIARAQPIDASSVVNGRLEKPGDVDVFAFKLKKGETLLASVDAFRSLRSPMDGVLQILSADGFVLEQNNDWSSLDPQIAFTSLKDGAYLVRLFAFPSVPDASIRLSGGETFVYRLTLTTGGFIDHTMPLAAKRSPSASVAIEGWNIPASARSLRLDTRDDVATVFHPDLANTFRVRVEEHPCWPGDSQRPATLSPPFSFTGRLPANGAGETIAIAGKKGQALNIRVESRDLGLAVNPVIRVLDADKKQLATAEPATINRDTELNFTPPADGVSHIEVRDQFGDGGPRFVYRLRVAPPEPGFDLTVAADRFALAPGKPLDIPVTVNRRGGFAKEITLAAEGLPAGVKAEIVPTKGEAKTITLRLSSDNPGPSGAFRIVGAAGDPKLVRTARAPLAEFETTTSELWLAVGGEVPPPMPKKKR
jgi:hypothetical protein